MLDDRSRRFWVHEKPLSRLDDGDNAGGVLIIVVLKPIAVFSQFVAVIRPKYDGSVLIPARENGYINETFWIWILRQQANCSSLKEKECTQLLLLHFAHQPTNHVWHDAALGSPYRVALRAAAAARAMARSIDALAPASAT